MTPCRTEKVDFSRKTETQSNTESQKKTTRQEKSPEKAKKTTGKKLHFPEFVFLVFLVGVSFSFLVCSVFFSPRKPYILCAAGVLI